jgi:hypothetical protein
VNQTWPHCVNQMGKTQSKPIVAWHGIAGERHGMCELAFMLLLSPHIAVTFLEKSVNPFHLPASNCLRTCHCIRCNVIQLLLDVM